MKNMRPATEPMKTIISLQQCSHEIIELATNYASDYLDCVENLPFDLQRSVTKLREIDQKCREYVKEIENLYESFMKENESNTSIKQRNYLLQIRRLFGLCKELGDEKIAIVQSISEAIESRNKQLEHACKRFHYAYDPSFKSEHLSSKKERDLKSDSAKGTKRSRRQRNTHSIDKHDKIHHQYKELAKAAKLSFYDAEDSNDQPPAKIMASASPDDLSPVAVPTPALTRAAQRDEDKRLSTKSTKNKKEEKSDEREEGANASASSTKSSSNSSTITTSSIPISSTQSNNKQNKNNLSNTPSTTKTNNKGKKKKRKSNKLQTEKQSSNSGDVSPIIDMPIEQDEPTYCLCQQVSFGQMIACDNLECPIEWFHFTCVRLQHKPKGKWYCPDCALKRKRDSKRDTR